MAEQVIANPVKLSIAESIEKRIPQKRLNTNLGGNLKILITTAPIMRRIGTSYSKAWLSGERLILKKRLRLTELGH
jgi:hypothetical protein